jgi:hypothetical protein
MEFCMRKIRFYFLALVIFGFQGQLISKLFYNSVMPTPLGLQKQVD